MPEQGDIVLIPVPFTDLSSEKRRPVVVVSGDHYNRTSPDIIVVAMTSNLEAAEYSFTLTTPDLSSGALKRPSKVRVDKIYTLSQGIVVKRFGKVKPSVLEQIRYLLNRLVE